MIGLLVSRVPGGIIHAGHYGSEPATLAVVLPEVSEPLDVGPRATENPWLEEGQMAGRRDVSALAAWAALPNPEAGDATATAPAVRSAPFRAASFDDPQGAVAAALLLISAVPHAEAAAPLAIAIAN